MRCFCFNCYFTAIITFFLALYSQNVISLGEGSFRKSGSRNLAQVFDNLGSYPAENQPSSDSEVPFPYGRTFLNDSKVHLSYVCGNWQRDYQELHRNIMAENGRSGKERFLIFSSCSEGIECGGAGDHIVGITSVFLLSIYFNRAFLIEWPELETTKAFEPSTFDWRIENARLNPKKKLISQCKRPSGGVDSVVLNFHNHFRGSYSSLLKCIHKLSSVSTIRVHLNRGITQWAVQYKPVYFAQFLEKSGLKSPMITGCLMRNIIKVGESVTGLIKKDLEVLQHTKKLKICIHSRNKKSIDEEFLDAPSSQNFNLQNYTQSTAELISCAKKLYHYWGQPSLGTVWFFMCGSLSLKRKIKDAYQDKVLITEIDPAHTDLASDRSQALITTLAEWYLFSQCHFFVLHDSGMSKTAAMYALRPTSVFVFGDKNLHGSCSPMHPSDPLRFGRTWSGL